MTGVQTCALPICIIEIINGLIAMFSTGFWGGLWQIIVGIIYIALARGLMGGSGVVRLIVAIVTILNIIAGVWEVLTFWSTDAWGARFIGGLVQAVVALLILILLYTPKATLFFKTHGKV